MRLGCEFENVRCLLTLCTAFSCIANLQAQHQEPSLVDRLLRPNMELQNEAQTKKFTANHSATVERRGRAETFYLPPNSRTEKSFADDRAFASTGYAGQSSYSGSRTIAATENQSSKKATSLGTSVVGDVHTAHDASNAVTGREYADHRQYTERGKSQKSLDRKNPPLTIDQVRELLNKNK